MNLCEDNQENYLSDRSILFLVVRAGAAFIQVTIVFVWGRDEWGNIL